MIEPAQASCIKSALADIVNDQKFRSSPQMCAFLTYVVAETLAGNEKRIKAYTVAVDALNKPPEFDAQDDPCVRVMAKRLRETLDAYYHAHQNLPVTIVMRAGSYVPKFEFAATTSITSNNIEQSSQTPAGLALASMAAPQLNSDSESPSITYSATQQNSNHCVTEDQLITANIFEHGQTSKGKSLFTRFSDSRPATITLFLVVTLLTMKLVSGQSGFATLGARQPDTEHAHASTGAGTAHSEAIGHQGLTSRPHVPTIYIDKEFDRDSLNHMLKVTISNVLSKFDDINVIYTKLDEISVGLWPEEYTLQLDLFDFEDRESLSMQLLRSSSGEIIHSAEVQFTDSSASSFSTQLERTLVEEAAAQMVQIDGPLLNDYFSKQNITPAMLCLKMIRDHRNARRTEKQQPVADSHNECKDIIASGKLPVSMVSRFVTHMRLEHLDELPVSERSQAINEVIELARESVEAAPYDAFSHALLMAALNHTDAKKSAMMHGKQALKLNPYCGHHLRNLAKIVVAFEGKRSAARLAQLADKVDPLPGGVHSQM